MKDILMNELFVGDLVLVPNGSTFSVRLIKKITQKMLRLATDSGEIYYNYPLSVIKLKGELLLKYKLGWRIDKNGWYK